MKKLAIVALAVITVFVAADQILAEAPDVYVGECPSGTITGELLTRISLAPGTRAVPTVFVTTNRYGDPDRCYRLLPPTGEWRH